MLYSLAAINTDILSECIITELEPVQSNQHMAYQGVCMWSIGVAIGYQHYYVNAFGPYYHNQQHKIDNDYVDGVSVTL